MRDIFEAFDFHAQVERLAKAELLYLVAEKFANIDLHPKVVSNVQMGAVFEELIRKFAELSNETAGEHFTPREVIRLMVDLIFTEDNDVLNKPHVVREIYGPTLEDVTDPHLVYDLRAKLDAAGHYDDFEVERVVQVQLSPSAKQGDLVSAITPVEDRLMKRYKAAQEVLRAAVLRKDAAAKETAQGELNALVLFKTDMAAYVRLYTFLSQIFDYGNTDIEKRAIFYKVLLPLLEFGREREGIDLSKVKLTHHTLKSLGKQPMILADGLPPTLSPIMEAGSGSLQEKQRAYLNEIIESVNQLFDGDLTDQDNLLYVNHVLKGKLLESDTLKQQATNNSKEQFANSPDLKSELSSAIIGALDAHGTMSRQALDSEEVRDGLKNILLNHAQLYETLRGREA